MLPFRHGPFAGVMEEGGRFVQAAHRDYARAVDPAYVLRDPSALRDLWRPS
jgi:hypothetical protein